MCASTAYCSDSVTFFFTYLGDMPANQSDKGGCCIARICLQSECHVMAVFPILFHVFCTDFHVTLNFFDTMHRPGHGSACWQIAFLPWVFLRFTFADHLSNETSSIVKLHIACAVFGGLLLISNKIEPSVTETFTTKRKRYFHHVYDDWSTP
jgi:hypothetical protein